MQSEEYSQMFEEFWQQVCKAHEEFSVWQVLNKELGANEKDTDPFWSVVFPCLQNSWILTLAKIFDPFSEDEDKKSISIKELCSALKKDQESSLKDVFKKHKEAIGLIRFLRDTTIAHLDKKVALDRESYKKKKPSVSLDKIELLLLDLEASLVALSPDGSSVVLDHMREQAKQKTLFILDKLNS